MKKVLFIFGTRPEAIKCCPVILEMQKRKRFDVKVCVTGQHKEILDQVMKVFKVKVDYNLEIMKEKQTLFDITSNILLKIEDVLKKEQPNLVFVHGDTTTSFVASLASFYLQIPVGHIEAGLRTNNLYSPFPEEFNRQAVGLISKFHFAPTEIAKENLLKEGKNQDNIWVTGNTAIDALNTTVIKKYNHSLLEWVDGRKLVVLTAHRRENWGEPLENIFAAIRMVAEEEKEIAVVFPTHPNPVVRETAKKYFSDVENIKMIEPLEVIDFHNIIARSYLVLTDSGGIQEEAPALDIPVLVMRDTTERPEGVLAGTLLLIGTKKESIYKSFKELLHNKELYKKMSNSINPYGDGFASKRIVDVIEQSV